MKFLSDQLESGRSYVNTVCSALWDIDGHRGTLGLRGCNVPEMFRKFNGYNTPELSKHRKRKSQNLNADKLADHTASLYNALLTSWLNTSEWVSFRHATETLARSLDSYVLHLRSQCKTMKLHHESSSLPVADKTSVQLLATNRSPSNCLKKLNDAISSSSPYEPKFIGDYAHLIDEKSISMCNNYVWGLVDLVFCALIPLVDE